jgi:enoyl-CoA hydratase/carnithine racemase
LFFASLVSFFSGAPGDADVAPAAPGAPPKVGLPVQMIHAFIDFPKPLITAVNGGCVGIGATMTQLGEFTLVADDAWFDTPFLPLGLVAEGCASLTFPRALGVGRANEMLFAGRKLSAAEAAASGFALKAVPRAALLPEALALAQEVAAMPLDSLVSTKKTMRDLTRAQLHALADKEGTEFARRLGEADFARALAAFKARKSKGKASVPAPETLVAKL